MRPVTNYPDTMPKASGCLRHVTKNDRKQNDDRLSFHTPLSLEMCISVATVVSDRRAALSEARHSLGIKEAISDNGSIRHIVFMLSRENKDSNLALVNSELVF